MILRFVAGAAVVHAQSGGTLTDNDYAHAESLIELWDGALGR
jgi:hypothetical protein